MKKTLSKSAVWNIFMVLGLTVAVGITTAVKLKGADGGQALLVFAAVGSVMGILSSVCSANAKIITFLFGLLDVSIYGTMCFISWADGGAGLGNGILHALYFIPMQFVGYFQWKKRGAHGGTEVKARRFTSRQWLLFGGIFTVSTIALYAVLLQFDRSGAQSFLRAAVLFDTLPLVCNILGQYLLSNAYREQWFFWIGVNVFSIAMWATSLAKTGDSYAIIYIIKYAFYFLNSINGLRVWSRLSR